MPAKRTNKAKDYAVKYLHQTAKMSIEEIAKELNIKVEDVQKIVDSTAEPKETPRKKSKVENMMITKTSGKKNSGVAIMTEAASQYNDEMKKKIQAKKQLPKGVNKIFDDK